MLHLNHHPSGRHYLQIPGPSPVPDRILRAMSLPTIDHRGPEFGALGLKVLAGIGQIFKTQHPVHALRTRPVHRSTLRMTLMDQPSTRAASRPH